MSPLTTFVIFLLPTLCLGQLRRPDNLALFMSSTPTYHDNPAATEGHRWRSGHFRSSSGSGVKQAIFASIDLMTEHEIDHVILVSDERYWGGNRDLSIWVSKSFSNTADIWKNDLTLCGSQGTTPIPARGVKPFKCQNYCKGRYIVITKDRLKEPWYIYEVEVYGKGTIQNKALYRFTDMGTRYNNEPRDGAAVDGLEGPEWSTGTCIHSNHLAAKAADYLSVDLGRKYRIFKVGIVNRIESLEVTEKYHMEVRVSEQTVEQALNTDYVLCYKRGKSIFSMETVFEFACDKIVMGRIVMYRMSRTYGTWYFNFCEMEVYADDIEENLALGKPTQSIDEIGTTRQDSQRAVDGIMKTDYALGSCIKTPGKSQLEWWMVDLKDMYVVKKVLIFSRIESNPEGACIYNLGLAASSKRIPDSAFTASSYYSYYYGRYKYYPKSARLSRNTYRGTDAWCPSSISTTQWLQIDLGKPTRVTGFTMQGAYYYFHISYFRIEYRLGTSGSFTQLKHPNGKQVQFPSSFAYYSHMRTTWLPKEIVTRYIRFYPISWRSRPCFRLEIHGCLDPVNELRNFKVKLAKTFDGTNYAKNKFTTCLTQKEPIPKGHLKFLHCDAHTEGRYVVAEKDPATGEGLSFCEFEVYGEKSSGKPSFMGKAMQSSTNGNHVAGNAVDGNRDSNMGRGSCAQTKVSTGTNWWAVDLGYSDEIETVIITSGAGSCDQTMRNLSLLATDTFDHTDFAKNTFQTCYRFQGIFQENEVRIFQCAKGTKGRYFVLAVAGQYPLSLCEVEVSPVGVMHENLALHKPASQNSDAVGYTDSARLAADGFRYTDPARNSMSLTPAGHVTWWSVDLQDTYHVRRAVIVNRKDDKAEWLGEFELVVATAFSPYSIRQVPHSICMDVDEPLKAGETLSHVCPEKAVGRYLFVIKKNNFPLALCEVEAYGSKPRQNLATGKRAIMNSDKVSGFVGSAHRAVDGLYHNEFNSGSCASTAGTYRREWWAVDLMAKYEIESVTLTNRGDCCAYGLREYYIGVTDVFDPFMFSDNWYYICNNQFGYPGGYAVRDHKCPPATSGQHVMVVKWHAVREPLVLCEVEVFGKPATIPPSHNKISYHGPPTQSAEYYSHAGSAGKAVDGKKKPRPLQDCAHTPGKANTEWWNVDLHAIYNVTRVEIGTYESAPHDHIHNITIVLSNGFFPEDLNTIANEAYRTTAAPTPTPGPTTTAGPTPEPTTAGTTGTTGTPTPETTTTARPPTTFTVCSNYNAKIIPGQVLVFHCPAGLQGRYLTVLKTPAKPHPLIMCEIEMFGVKAANIPGGVPEPGAPPLPIP